MKKSFSQKSLLSASAISLGVPPTMNRHQVISSSHLASVAAVGTITLTALPSVGGTITIHDRTWTFVALRNHPWEITVGATAAATVTNIVAAIKADFGPNAQFKRADGFYVVAADGAGDTVTITWCELGTVGNAIVFTEAASNLTMDGSGTLGGTTAGVGDGSLHDADAGSGALAYKHHLSPGDITDASGFDYTSGTAPEVILVTGMLDSITVTPTSLDADCSIRVVINSWQE